MKQLVSLLVLLLVLSSWAQAQSGVIIGTVRDQATKEPLIGATVTLEGTSLGAATDASGNFRIANIPPKTYNVVANYVGYGPTVRSNIVVTSGNASQLNLELSPAQTGLQEVEIVGGRTRSIATIETPLSVQRLSTEEIRSNPGGNFDISRVVQTLPGVGGTAGSVGGFRNDIIIRGGAPNENVYYLDGIEVPVINHFATQGSAGGPAGILNVSFIEDVTLSSSAFDARYDNVLSSVLQFRQREGNPERIQGNVRLSGTELATTLEGPLSPRTTFLASGRRSYLQLLFQLIDLPILPSYWDYQYKVTHKIDDKTTLSAIGLGAIDDFRFTVPRESSPEKAYILNSQPVIRQWNNTTGFALKRRIDRGVVNVALSANFFNNKLDRFDSPEETEASRRLKVRSQENEVKLRTDVTRFLGDWKVNYGANAQYSTYTNETFNRLRAEIRGADGELVQPGLAFNFNTDLDFWRFGAFTQVSRSFLNARLDVSGGLRTDVNTFTDTGLNPLRTLSPRMSASYRLRDNLRLNATTGLYYKIPPYTVLGFAEPGAGLVNRGTAYIRSLHYAAGVEYLLTDNTRFTVEGFYKGYSDYPVSVRNGISLANEGGDFSPVGNEPVTSTGRGRSYGTEFLVQQKLTKNFFAVFAYTLFWSEFSGADPNAFVASAWDNRHLVSFTGGYKLPRNWELGAKFRYQGAAPYTPFAAEASQRNYATLGSGILDYGQLNTLRLAPFHQLDLRVDKKWNFRRLTLDLFLDVTNVYLNANPAYPNYTFARDAANTAFVTTDGLALQTDGSNAIPLILRNESTTAVPTIGFIVEF